MVRFEAFLARLYTDAGFREKFLLEPAVVAKEAGLSEEEASAAAAIDRVGLKMAARTFAFKRKRLKT